jgi:hypothetical protein
LLHKGIVLKTNFYMRTHLLLFTALVLAAGSMDAQTVATFDDLALAHADTYYVNYSAPGMDVGFNDGHAHFPCIYSTAPGDTTWSYFAYSNMTDSVTSGYGNQYSAKTAIGYDSSANYATVSVFNPTTYANSVMLNLAGSATGHPVAGFYITNSTYAYNSMRDGDMFARKFHNGDWFKLTVHGYYDGALLPDSVTFYLADFLFPDTTMNYILKTWQWVNLLPLGNVDSLQFSLSSTDNSIYGMNTPAYFCMDNFTTTDGSGGLSAPVVQVAPVAKVYPNPAMNELYVDILDNTIQKARIIDVTGNIIGDYNVILDKIEINTSTLQPGVYMLQLQGNGKSADLRFVKQ